jgi:hypothetical protein
MTVQYVSQYQYSKSTQIKTSNRCPVCAKRTPTGCRPPTSVATLIIEQNSWVKHKYWYEGFRTNFERISNQDVPDEALVSLIVSRNILYAAALILHPARRNGRIKYI